MRRALLVVACLPLLCAALPAQAARACAWIAESVEDDGEHMFRLNLDIDAPTSVAVRFQGPGFTSGAMGGDLISFDPGQPKEVDGDGFDVSAGDELSFSVQLFDRPLSLDDLDSPPGRLLAEFVFRRKVGEHESAPPADLAAKQCQPLG